jgi:hypothetical protein
VVLTSTYDADGNRTSLSAKIGGTADFVNSYSYDSQNREVQVAQGSAGGNTVDTKLVNFSYDADGEMKSIDRYAKGSTTDLAASVYGYSSSGQVTGLTHTAASGATYAADAWTYDADGEVKSFADAANVGGVSCYSGDNISGYSYLCLCQLAVADFSALSIMRPAKLTQPLRWTVASRSFCYCRSQGTSRCSFAHRSMAA